MSMDRCSICSWLVDTDDDVEFYICTNGRDYIGMCERCRESREESGECEDDPRCGQSADINRRNER